MISLIKECLWFTFIGIPHDMFISPAIDIIENNFKISEVPTGLRIIFVIPWVTVTTIVKFLFTIFCILFMMIAMVVLMSVSAFVSVTLIVLKLFEILFIDIMKINILLDLIGDRLRRVFFKNVNT